MAQRIGPTWTTELMVAGLGGLNFSWTNDGTFYNLDNLTADQQDRLQKVFEYHDPTRAWDQPPEWCVPFSQVPPPWELPRSEPPTQKRKRK